MYLIARRPTSGFINKAIAWKTAPVSEMFNFRIDNRSLSGKWVDNGYSHTEIKFSDGVCISASQYENAVRKKNIKATEPHWETIKLSVTDEEEKIVREWMESKVGSEYDYLGIVGFIFTNVDDDNGKWFCSEITFEALQQINYLKEFSTLNSESIHPRKVVEVVKLVEGK